MPFNINNNNSLPILGNNRGLEEIDKVTPFLNQLQNNWTNFKNYYNRLSGGIGFNSNEIADLAINTNHLNLTSGNRQRITSWTGNDINLNANEIFVLYTFNLLNPKINSEIDIMLQFFLGVYGDKSFNIYLERQNIAFTQNTGYLLNVPNTNLVNIGFNNTIFYGLQTSTNTFRQIYVKDTQNKPIGITYYRVSIKANSAIRVYNGSAEDTSASYRIY